jgi:hypothetical protein
MLINIDIENRFCGGKAGDVSQEKVDRMILLMNKIGLLLYNKEKISKYLVYRFTNFRKRILIQVFISSKN